MRKNAFQNWWEDWHKTFKNRFQFLMHMEAAEICIIIIQFLVVLNNACFRKSFPSASQSILHYLWQYTYRGTVLQPSNCWNRLACSYTRPVEVTAYILLCVIDMFYPLWRGWRINKTQKWNKIWCLVNIADLYLTRIMIY